MSNVYKKLQEARTLLKKIQMKKSGENTFAGYDYFELSDFLPHITEICNKVGLCCVPSFDNELATLTVYDTESTDTVLFTSPMVTITMKGCNEIQCLGSVETYLRRYLYMNAFEITENDPSEALTGSPQTQKTSPSKKTVSKSSKKSESKADSKEYSKEISVLIEKGIKASSDEEKKGLLKFIKTDLGITPKEIGTTSKENLDKIKEYIEINMLKS